MVKPDPATFLMNPIKALLKRIVRDGKGWADPTAGWNSPAEFTNDLNPKAPTQDHRDAIDYLSGFKPRSLNGVLLDPPYSPRQMKEVYDSIGLDLSKAQCQSSWWSGLKDEAARVIRPGGRCVVFGWNSLGLSQSRGFTLEEIHLFPAGGMHNDTIVTVEQRRNGAL